MPRTTALTAKPLSLAERKARVARIAKDAPEKVKRGIALIDFREPTPAVKEFAKSLEGRARKALARPQRKAA